MVSGQARPAGGLPFQKLAWNPWSVQLHLGPAACTPLRLSPEQGLVLEGLSQELLPQALGGCQLFGVGTLCSHSDSGLSSLRLLPVCVPECLQVEI